MTDSRVTDRLPDADRLAKRGHHPYIRPKDASTLIILHRQDGDIRFLAGRRSDAHKFMPGLYVFPGGRVDRSDYSIKPSSPLPGPVAEKLLLPTRKRITPRMATALGTAAIRETYEETGLIIGDRSDEAPFPLDIRPSLEHLRFIARAITPTGRVKRFDTRFFALFADEAGIVPEMARSSDELEQLEWVPFSRSSEIKLPDITRAVLADLTEMLDLDAELPFGSTVPFYHVRNRRFVREEL